MIREPDLQHIWVQLGHMEKEAGRPDQAAAAYTEASRLRPHDAEPLLHLGHMAKTSAQPVDAARFFVDALRRAPGHLEATAELVRLLPDRDDVGPELWSGVLAVLGIDPAEQAADDAVILTPGATLLDVTDLLAFFGRHRLPTGIQRVQIEVALACLEGLVNRRPVFCVYSSARRGWVGLPDDVFEAVCRLAKRGDDPARTIRFPAGATLVNLGTSWSDRNYLLDVRLLRARDAVVYVALVFDLIPMVRPDWFIGSLVRDYRAWFGSLLRSADACIAISNATRGDLLRTAAEQGAPMQASRVSVVRLDGDFRQAAAPAAALAARGLEPGRYVLFVSTLEPRKNHRGAFEAWLALADELGEAAVPRLVCVGGRGWLNEDVHRMLRVRPALRRMIVLLHDVPDDELAMLYEQCRFALYPSFHEGWGLPVSEALSYGKVPATSGTSSMPEAGGAFARYFDPADPQDIAAAARALLDDDVRGAMEDAIRRRYRPRSWAAIAQDILARTTAVAPRREETLPRLDGEGVWTLASGGSDAGGSGSPTPSGEALRHGRAWCAPGPNGCGIRGDDAALWFRWGGGADALLQMRFAASPAEVRVGVGGAYRDLAVGSGQPAVTHPIPTTSAVVPISIVPLAGDVVVEEVAVIRDRAPARLAGLPHEQQHDVFVDRRR